MAYLHPGVYIEEIPSGSKPIEGVATSVAAFVGRANRGPTGSAELIQSFDDYNDLYGDIASQDDAMGFSVQSFYMNGGKSAFICRLVGDGSTAASTLLQGQDTGGADVFRIDATSEGEWGNQVYVRVVKPDPESLTFDLEIGHRENDEFVLDEEFKGLSMRAEDDAYALTQVNGNSPYIELSLEDAANPEESSEQYQGATLTGGAVDSGNDFFNSGIDDVMRLALNINGLGSEQITLDPTALALGGTDHNADGNAVATAIRDAVRALSLDAPHQTFDCTYDTASNRFELATDEHATSASLEVYEGELASLLRLDGTQHAELTGSTVLGGATRFSSGTNGLPSLAQPMTLVVNIDGYAGVTISLLADELDLIVNKAADGETLARAIQDAVQASNRSISAFKDFTCEFESSRFVLTSGSGDNSQSSLSVEDGEFADFLNLQASDTPVLVPGREVVQGSARVVPAQDLGTRNHGVKLEGGTENPANAGDFTEFYDSTLRKVRDVSIIVVPGESWADDGSGNALISATLAHCQAVKSRIVIIDPPPNLELDQQATVTQLSLPSSTYSALYYPWVRVANPFYHAEKNPTADKTVEVAPSAFAAGMWSRIDGKRGVWKAPAGMEAGLVGAAGLKYIVEDGEQDQLNPLGVNCYRNMPGGGRVIWGARTLATKADPEWRYVPVRRTAIMIEQSIYNGIQWAVFEPNDHRLWAALRGNIGGFMNSLFRVGAFQGEKASDAYFVRCGKGDTMTQTDIDAGQVIVVVGFAPLKPAEFVIVRIQQKVEQQ